MSLEKKEQLKKELFLKILKVPLNPCGNICHRRQVWLHHLKWKDFKDLHHRVELVQVEFQESRWHQKWSVKPEKNISKIEGAKKVEHDQELILKNMKLNSFVFNKGVLRKSFMKKWKNSIMISTFNQEWVNISHLFGIVTRILKNKRTTKTYLSEYN